MYVRCQALSWSMFELCRHPEIQDRIYNEVRAIMHPSKSNEIGKDLKHQNLGYEEIQQMKYLEAFCYEVRKYDMSNIYPLIYFLIPQCC